MHQPKDRVTEWTKKQDPSVRLEALEGGVSTSDTDDMAKSPAAAPSQSEKGALG